MLGIEEAENTNHVNQVKEDELKNMSTKQMKGNEIVSKEVVSIKVWLYGRYPSIRKMNPRILKEVLRRLMKMEN